MKIKLLTIFTVACLATNVAYSADTDEQTYIDPRFGRAKSSLYDLINAKPEPELMFWLKDSLFSLKEITQSSEIDKLYQDNAKGVKPPVLPSSLNRGNSKFVDVNVLSIFSYLFKNYLSKDKHITIPFVVSNDTIRHSAGYDSLITQGKCKGMTHLEANLKGCTQDENTGFLEINYQKKLGLSLAKFQLKHIPDNGINESYSHKLFRSIASLLGIKSNLNSQGFVSPKTSFDKFLFAKGASSSLSDKQKFFKISDKCSLKNSKDCNLYFRSKDIGDLHEKADILNNLKNANSDFLKVYFDDQFNVYFDLNNTLLSDSSFINYGFYTEAELQILKDIGYNIAKEDFIGTSIFQNGTFNNLKKHIIKQGFYAYSDTTHEYQSDKISKIPLSVGTHVYGDYNLVEQQGNIASIGYASIGMRVDGSNNTIIVPKNTAIIENGIASSGIAITNGSYNHLNIDGLVEASSEDGIALRFDFGSNVLSDLNEYQGSYRRVRTHDYQNFRLTKDKAQAYQVPQKVQGPIASEVNIKGQLIGKKSAIFIDQSTHVKTINFFNKAKIKGNIISKWSPYYNEKTKAFYAPHKNTALLDGKLVFSKASKNYTQSRKSLENELRTKLNFGVKEGTFNGTVKSLRYDVDDNANMSVQGGIIGNSLDLSAFGGHTHINGYLNLNRLYIGNSVVNINTTDGHNNFVNELELNKVGQLDFSNGIQDTFYVRQKAAFSSNSVVCLDIDKDANLIDQIEFLGKITSRDGVLNLEPGLSYSEIKILQSDPKQLYTLLNKFLVNSNNYLSKYGLTSSFPKHVWYTQGDLGRKVNCASRGCYLGDFVKSYSKSQEKIPTWRYILSILGCIVLLIGSYMIFKKTTHGRFG